ncbi:hypothetical protein V1505DRAFT_404887 [Lipomyces doorenjongii]
MHRSESMDSSDSDPNQASSGRKRPLNTAAFCTQRCLLTLQQGGMLDSRCPNQLDEDLDHNCTPFGACGAYGAPFKVTLVPYGYTVVGKGNSIRPVERSVARSGCLPNPSKSSGICSPSGGKDTTELEHSKALLHEIKRSKRKVRALGVVHGDFRFKNVLWNEELGRALVIDFHRSKLAPRLMEKRKSLCETQVSETKRLYAA